MNEVCIYVNIDGEVDKTSAAQSRARMEKLGKEYTESVEQLRNRVQELRMLTGLLTLSAKERKLIERRIELLEKEIREARRTGSEAAGFYLPGHRFLPMESKAQRSRYVC